MTSPKACGSSSAAATAEQEDVGMILCVLGFVGIWMYFAIGAAFLYKKGERGMDMVIHKYVAPVRPLSIKGCGTVHACACFCASKHRARLSHSCAMAVTVRASAREWWKTLPGLIWDGMQFTSAKGKETYAKFRGGDADPNYSELK